MSAQTIKRFELKANKTNFPKQKITRSIDGSEFIKQFYADDIEIYESFFILMLDRAGTTAGYAKISQGGIAGTVVDIRIILKYCIDTLCSSVIIAHNHPSGSLKPSALDLAMTKKVKQALELVEIQLSDSLILTSSGYYSLRDNGDI